ncbi:MAG: hypothetical protein P1U58_18505 [Verrucomicrobiales bacterium]|nr:hypothetical protein [Verrucomicrobiales bacterium]
MKRAASILIRLVSLLLLAAVATLLIGQPLLEKREERRVRVMLLTVQEALQNYHVKEEIYPRDLMTGAQLVHFLKKEGFLEEPLQNPWTREAFGNKDEPDGLRYRTDTIAETYELIVYKPGTEIEQFRLDSTENQSLE